MQDSQIQNIELQLLQSQLQNEIRDKQYFQQQYLEQQQLNMQLQADLQQYAETSGVLQKQQLVSSAYFSQQIDSQRQEIDDLKLFSSSKHCEKLSTHQQETQFLFNQFYLHLAPKYLYQALQSNISFNISSFTSIQILCYITDQLVSANLLTEENFWKSLSSEMNTSQYIAQSIFHRIVQQFCVQYTSNIDKVRFERLRAEFDLLIQHNGEINGSQKLVFSGVQSQENENVSDQINQHKTHQYEAKIQELQHQNTKLQEQLNKQIQQNETLVNNGAQMGKLVFQLQSEQSALYDRISEQNSICQPTNPIPEINIQSETQIPETNILDAPEQIQTYNQVTPLVNEIEPQNSSKRSFADRLKEKEIDLNALKNQPIYFSLNDSNIKLTPPIQQPEKRQYVTKPIKRRDTNNKDNQVIEVDQRENNIQTNIQTNETNQQEAQKEVQKSQETQNNAQPQKTPAKRTPKKITSPQFEEVVSIDESSDAAQPIINQRQRNQINQHMEQTFIFTIKNILGRVYKTDIQNKSNTELCTMIDTLQPKASKDFWKELVVMAKECFDNEKMAQRYYQTQFKKVVQ
ncbi:Hypothetical_protein [Hexamita inflata]|uniref:Hypothetical_protein n=1 Tax=Hexamita inflata TaxID=28002 RepID=A0AA86VRQ9_9EUKA|nr:Hypothetical protein HINF_LOCUS62478 [Hexamita inflata]